MNKKDELINFYDIIPKKFTREVKKDKNFNDHLIEPTSNIMIIGQTGAGKTQAVLNFLKRKNGVFTTITIFTGSTADEPLYNYLVETNDEIEIIDDVEEMPELQDFEDEKEFEHLMIFDDVANLDAKATKKMKNFVKACRKYGFTCLFLYQQYANEKEGGAPKFIRDNCQIFFVFKLQSNSSLEYIIRDKAKLDISKQKLLNMYNYATDKKGSFLCIDTKAPKELQFRRNFIEILKPNLF